jgi:murein DD-endopeptidase MepM/ murein hydrolase activator NlpD
MYRAVCGLCVLSWLCCETTATPLSAPKAPPLRGVWHELGPGETLAALARRYGVPLEDIEELNGIARGTAPVAGRAVFLPGARPLAARGGDAAASRPRARRRPASTPAAALRLLWPVPGGLLTSGFGARDGRPHEGIDIAAPEGSAVLAAADGVVIYSGSGVRGYGNLILIRHAGDLVTVYAHNRRNRVAEKDRVRRGQTIAEVGRTGSATANHLHFEVRRGEAAEDPTRHVGSRERQ